MNKILIFLILSSMFPLTLFAKEADVQAFAQSLESRLGIQAARVIEVGSSTLFAHPALLKKWGLVSATAEASYNGFINTIELKEEATIQDGERWRLKTLEELEADKGAAWPVVVGTIFHELGHAEFDQYIEEEKSPADRALYTVFRDEIRPWMRRRLNLFKAGIAQQELFGYYRDAIIEILVSDMGDILLYNGINQYNGRFFKPRSLESQIHLMSEEEFSRLLLPPGEKMQQSYRERIEVPTIWMLGEALELKTQGEDPFQKSWFAAIWDHFANFHNPRASAQELTEFLARTHPLMTEFAEFRRAWWQEVKSRASSAGTDLFQGIENPGTP